jgi:integrase
VVVYAAINTASALLKMSTMAKNQARLSYQGTSYAIFMDALKSPFTKESYGNSFRRYLEYHKLKSPDDLLIHAANPHYIESQIIDYVKHLRKNGIAYASIEFYVAPVFTFYQLNDVVLNRKKISRYYGEYKRVAKDEAYTTLQIQQMLQNADQRMRMIILLLSSTAARIGSLPALTLGNLTKLPDYGLYKIVFYDGTSSEYYNFCTRECASTGIDHTL